jgi:predicted PurR-regulated permease PerM
LITALVVLFLGIYLAFSPVTYINGLLSLLPMSKRHSGRQILGEAGHKLRLWIIGQIISMTAVGVLIGLGLLIVGIPVPLVIGVVAGLLDIIPIFGPIVAAIPAILLGFTVTPMHALYAVLVFIAVNQAESHLLVPLIQRYSVLLPPALTVFALLLMGSLFGFWGLLLAAPITATLLVFIKRIYSEPVLHDPAVTQHD